MTNDQLIAWIDETKAAVRQRLDGIAKTLTGWKPTSEAARALVDRAEVNVGNVLRDGSFGVHNAKKTNALLDEALELTRQAVALTAPPPSVQRLPTAPLADPKQTRPANIQSPHASVSKPIEANSTTEKPATAATDGSPHADAWYVVPAKDTLSLIAAKAYGDPALYRLIFKSNRKVLADPDDVRPAQRIFIPRAPDKTPAAARAPSIGKGLK